MAAALAITLAGCGTIGGRTPTPLPTVVLGDTGSSAAPGSPVSAPAGVIASGVAVPAQQSRLAFALAGQVESAPVAVGERVSAGQALARLEGAEELQAAVSAAELQVLNAEQALQSLSDDLFAEQTAALQTLNAAREAVRSAQQKLDGLGVSSEPIDIQVARSNVALARNALDKATKDFKPYENKPEDSLQRAALLSKLADAQKRYDNAVKQLNRLTGTIVPEFNLQQAQTGLEIAQAQLKLAEDRYNLLLSGPDPEAVTLAQARLKTAQDQAAAARARLASLEILAPFDGTVSSMNIHSGEWALPGQAVIEIVDLEHMLVKTTDLSERDISAIQVGQAATVYIEALDATVSGRVTLIAPLADTLGGDVVYETTIELQEPVPGLRAGMTAEVQFSAGE
jgi:multidrug efflux pump subunit AcrA (membrane-fusion protein)